LWPPIQQLTVNRTLKRVNACLFSMSTTWFDHIRSSSGCTWIYIVCVCLGVYVCVSNVLFLGDQDDNRSDYTEVYNLHDKNLHHYLSCLIWLITNINAL
jgi:hypothetical protein